MPNLLERGKGFWSAIVIVGILIVATPFVRWINANLLDLVGIFLFVVTIDGYFIFEGLKPGSEQVLLMREGDHFSRSQVGEVADLPGTPGVSASRVGITFGGLEIRRFNIANRHLLNVPGSAVERVPIDDEEDYLVYAPSISMTAEQHYGVDSAMSDIAEQSVSNAFRTGDRSPSRARFSVFNSLVAEPTADGMRFLKDEVSRSAKPTAEGKRKGELSEEHNVRRLRKLSDITRPPTLGERIGRVFKVAPSKGNPDKPTGEEGQ